MDADHPVDLGVQGELFADLLTAWRLTRPHAVAHDYGGAVALRAHLLHHVQFASLCLVDVVALRPWGSPYFMLVKEHAGVFSRLPAAVHRGALEAYIATASHRGLRPEQMNDLTRPWLGEPGQSAFYRQIAQADERFTDEFESRLGSISVPVHVIWGGEDTWIPVRQGERLHRAIPGSTLSVIPDAGHLIHYDAPVALADQLATWLTARSHR